MNKLFLRPKLLFINFPSSLKKQFCPFLLSFKSVKEKKSFCSGWEKKRTSVKVKKHLNDKFCLKQRKERREVNSISHDSILHSVDCGSRVVRQKREGWKTLEHCWKDSENLVHANANFFFCKFGQKFMYIYKWNIPRWLRPFCHLHNSTFR